MLVNDESCDCHVTFPVEGWSDKAVMDAWETNKVAAMTEAGLDPCLEPGGLHMSHFTP